MLSNDVITLRPIAKTDRDRLVRWLNDPVVAKQLHPYKPISEMAEAAWLEDLPHRNDLEFFIIELAGSNLPVGFAGLRNIDQRNQHAILDVVVGEQEYVESEFELAAANLLLQYAFAESNLNKITLKIPAYHQKGLEYAERLGFLQEAKLREDVFVSGSFHDVYQFSLLRREWIQSRSNK